MARNAALLALVLALLALAYVGSRQLDEHLVETRYVVTREPCQLREWRAGQYDEQCPLGSWRGDS